MIVQGMPDLQGLDSELLDLVARLETACLLEALEAGALERFIPTRSNVLQEPPEERLVHVVQAAAIALGRLSAAHRTGTERMADIVDAFASGQLAGLAKLGHLIDGAQAEVTVRRANHFTRLFAGEAATRGHITIDEPMRQRLTQHVFPRHQIYRVLCALASSLGTLARLHGWQPADAKKIIERAHEGVLAGEAAREEESTRR